MAKRGIVYVHAGPEGHEAYKKIVTIEIPIIVRLQGTNAQEGVQIIESSGLKVTSAILLKDAAQRVKEVLKA